MREFVGVIHPFQFLRYPFFKREALIFSKIALPHYNDDRYEYYDDDEYESIAYIIKSKFSNDLLNELDWLIERGIIITPDTTQVNPSLYENKEYVESIMAQANKYLSAGVQIGRLKAHSTPHDLDDASFFKDALDDESCSVFFESAFQETIRHTCIKLRLGSELDAYPILFDKLHSLESATSNKSSIVKIILTSLPILDESTPWEQIIEYRSDPDSQSKLLALRHWMSEVARAELTPSEVEEKLEYLIDQYQQHMRLHRIKTNVGTLETIVTTGAEFLGDLVSFKWGKAAEALFSLKRRRVALLEGELTAPGNEVAYIVKARETFS